MKHNSVLAVVLSMLFPGLGQVYIGKRGLGTAIMLAFIIIGNLNAIWLSVFATSSTLSITYFGYTFPRLLHDIFAFYGIIFWIWQAVDTYLLAKKD
jgi:TM2 domain-containing membrane protein YozV